jgi:rhodanese-related sulfurtransferase
MTRPINHRSSAHHGANRRLLVILVMTTGLMNVSSGSADADDVPPAPSATPALPPAKQTTLGLYVTAREAYEKWKAAPGRVTILDVRTPEEFLFVGHADMALNVPVAAQLYKWDANTKQFPMQPLPDFVARVRKVAKPDDTLLVMCRSGGRSAIAVNLLAAAGFKKVYSITDGMEGDPVQDPGSVFRGQRLVNGWKNSGLPWTYDVDPDR